MKRNITIGIISVIVAATLMGIQVQPDVDDEITDNYLQDRLLPQEDSYDIPTLEPQNGDAARRWWNSSWHYSKKITVNSSQINATLTNFPICMNITDSDLATNAQADGDDVVFVSADNTTQYNHEIELYNDTTGHLVAWVNVTSLSNSTDTEIYIYYGNDAASNQEDVDGVWDLSKYEAVYHFNDLSGNLMDSTSNNYDGSNYGGVTYESSGIIGNSYSYDGNNDWTDTTYPGGTDEFTMSCWVNVPSVSGRLRIMLKERTSADINIHDMGIDDGSVEFQHEYSQSNYYTYTGGSVSTNTWSHMAISSKNSETKLFNGGALVDSDNNDCTGGIWESTSYNVEFMHDNQYNKYYEGYVDEARIYKVAISDDWIITSYNSINNATDGGFFSLDAQENNYLSAWDYRTPITINSSQITSTLTNFPICINITDDGLLKHAQTDGDDILFMAASDGWNATQQYNHEIEYFNKTTGQLVAWVNITNLTHDADVELHMYYGNDAASNQQDVENTWSSGYLMVQHLNETSGTHYDSTSNDNDGTPNGDVTQDYDGIIDGGDYFDGSSEHVYCGTDTNFAFGNEAHSFSAWIYPTATPNSYNYIISVGNNAKGEQSSIGLTDNKNLYCSAYSSPIETTNYAIPALDQWYHIVGVYDGTSMNFYVDGEFKETETISLSVTTGKCYIMAHSAGVNGFTGSSDEVHIYNRALSSDEINVNYNNQNNATDGGFYSLDSTETQQEWWNCNWSYSKQITINSSQIPADCTNFPICINITDTHLKEHAVENGSDIAFIAENNITQYNHEIEYYDNGTGKLVAWINITTLYADADTVLYIYYGNDAASNQENPTGVWDSNYKMVQHLEETDIDGGSGDIKDSTVNNYDGTTSGMDINDQVTGILDGSFDFDGSNDYINCGSAVSSYFEEDFTFSAWVNIADGVSTSDHLDVIRINSGDRVVFYASTAYGSANGQIRIFLDVDGSISEIVGSDIRNSGWTLLTVTSDDLTFSLYENGQFKDDVSTTSLTLNTDLTISSSSFTMKGLIDEVKVSRIVRSDAWITTEYNSMNNATDGGFFTLGSLNTAESESIYLLNGLQDNNISWYGREGETVWCNSSGTANETIELIAQCNSTEEVTGYDVHICNMTDGNGHWITADTVQLYASSNNSDFGIPTDNDGNGNGVFLDGGSNISLNATTWNTGTMGPNPFTIEAGTQATVYIVLKATIPADQEGAVYSSTTDGSTWSTACKVYIKGNRGLQN